MATVYLARDVKHNRQVALKVLNPELGAVLGVERFLSEIQVTARLQHPNLVPLFDSGEADGLLFYVMPYVAGESLRARIERERQLPIDEAVRITTAAAAAVDYAHRQGVIHRDLKPENILLHEGQPLVADFGIALAISAAGGTRLTQTGLSLGTPQYMSPEQATGDRIVDQRTDVYSLGAIAYEMLTGEPPHSGSTAQAVVARILTEQPRSIRATRPSVSRSIEAAVMRALEKIPADRWPNAHGFADALSAAAAVAVPTGESAPATITVGTRLVRALRRRPALVAGALAAAVLVGLAIRQIGERSQDRPSFSFVVDPPVINGVRQVIGDFALSPDGEMIALVAITDSGSHAFLRRFSEPNATPIPGTKNAMSVAFSPTSDWLAFVRYDGRLLKTRLEGSAPPMTLADGLDSYSGLAWADEQTIVLGSVRPQRAGLGRLAATGGAIDPVTSATKEHVAHGVPYVAPDGNTVFFTEWGPGFTEDDYLAIGALETGSFRTSPFRAGRAIGVVDGHALYTTSTSLMAVPFDGRRTTFTGEPIRILDDVTVRSMRSAHLSASGTLAYMRGQLGMRLLLLDRDGRTQRISDDDHNMWSIGRFSPDGQRIAVDVWVPSGDTSATDIWTFDVKDRTFTRVSSIGNVVQPTWTVDGRALLFTTWFPREATLWRQVADGSQPAEPLLKVPNGVGLFEASATPDGKGVVFCRGSILVSSDMEEELFYLPFGGTAERLVDEPMSSVCSGRVSPDGRWLAYGALEAGRPHVFVRPFRRPGGRVKVSDAEGLHPLWSRDGSRIFYSHVAGERGMMWVTAATGRATGNTFEVVSRERVVSLPQTRAFDLAPDGRILAMEPSFDRVQLVVMTNWVSRLRDRLARPARR